MTELVKTEDVQLDDALATSIIEVAIPLGAYDGDTVPDTEKSRLRVAEEILDVCLEFWGNGYYGHDVKQIFAAAGIHSDDSRNLTYDGNPDPVEDPVPPAESVPATPPIEVDPPAEDKVATDDPPEPWAGYSDGTIAKIKQFISENSNHIDAEVLGILLDYEKANKNRATLISFYNELAGDTSDEDARHEELDQQAEDAAERDPDPEPEPEVLSQEIWDEAKANVSPLNGAEKDLDSEHHLPGVGERKQGFARSHIQQARAEREHLPVPPEPGFEDDPVLPADLDDLSHDKVNQLMIDFTACLTRATWLAALSRIDYRHAKRVLSREQALAFQRAMHETSYDGKALPEWKVKAIADADDESAKWSEIVEECRDALDTFESMRDSYQASVDALSRVEGFRHAESSRSR